MQCLAIIIVRCHGFEQKEHKPREGGRWFGLGMPRMREGSDRSGGRFRAGLQGPGTLGDSQKRPGGEVLFVTSRSDVGLPQEVIERVSRFGGAAHSPKRDTLQGNYDQ